MAYRKFESRFWKDPFVQALSISAKLLYVYFFTNDNCNSSGAYQISMKTVAFDTGLNEKEIKKMLAAELRGKVLYFEDYDIVVVSRFLKHQAQSSKFVIGAMKQVASMPKLVRNAWFSVNRDVIESFHLQVPEDVEEFDVKSLYEGLSEKIRKDNREKFSKDVVDLTLYFIKAILDAGSIKIEGAKKRYQSWLKDPSKISIAWLDDIRLLVNRDGAKPDEIREVINIAVSDDFWRSNILSPGKLRKHYNKLLLIRDKRAKSGIVSAEFRKKNRKVF